MVAVLLLIVAAVLVVTGVALLSIPAALIVAGAALAAFALLADLDRTGDA